MCHSSWFMCNFQWISSSVKENYNNFSQGKKFDLDVTDDVTGQVKVNIFDFSGLVTSASKISMLRANKANEWAWIVSLTSVSIISCAL